MHDLIVAALQEGRIDRRERFHAVCRKAGGERHSMLFGNAHIEMAVREFLGENVGRCAGRHGSRDRANLVVSFSEFRQGLAKHFLVIWRLGFWLRLLAGDYGELRDPVIFVRRIFGRRIAFALLGNDVDQDRAVLHRFHILENREKRIEIVTIDRPDIIEAEFLEQRAAHGKAAQILLRAPGRTFQPDRRDHFFGDPTQTAIGPRRYEFRQVIAHRADRRRNRHVIIVQDYDQAGFVRAGIVHGLIGHASRHGSVTNHADNMRVAALQVARLRKAMSRRNGGGCVRSAKRVVFALGTFREA